MSEVKKVVFGKFYYLEVMPHPGKDGVRGTQEKAEQMKNALENLGVTVYLQSRFVTTE